MNKYARYLCTGKTKAIAGSTTYRLVDQFGRVTLMGTKGVKTLLESDPDYVVNITLKSNGQLYYNSNIHDFSDKLTNNPKRDNMLLDEDFVKYIERLGVGKEVEFRTTSNLVGIYNKALMLGREVLVITNSIILLISNEKVTITVSYKKIDLVNCDGNSGTFSNTRFSKINLKGIDSSRTSIMANMFWGCQAKEIYLTGLEDTNLVNAHYMFYKCNLDILDISSFKATNLRGYKWAFTNCDIKDLRTSSEIIRTRYEVEHDKDTYRV